MTMKIGAAALVLSAPAGAAAQDTAAPAPLFRLPPNYISRFGGTETLADSATGFGVRGFPLPFTQDIRLNLAKRPNYWEYALSTRLNDTTFAAGVFDNGAAAKAGIPRLDVNHDPWKGVQYRGLVQGNGASSRFTGGYAFTAFQDRVRVLNNVGVAYQGTAVAPYTQTEVYGNYGRSFGKVNASINSTGRVFTLPVQKEVQGSIDVTVAGNVSPVEGLTLEASHLERFTAGKITTIPDLNLARYYETNAAITYRLPVSEPNQFGVGAVRTRLTNNSDKYTYWRNDVLFRAGNLPVLIGPSVGYQWSPAGTPNQVLFGVSILGK
ncbi:hypothetical protein Dcar01_00506 [Deinococcus carri]|uniref:Porin n=1 Tax=Deinococcus carri TaxID=1211323 RepID=A0ABP9W763_9DEIO